MELPSGQTGSLAPGTAVGASTQASTEQDELTQRLARLRQMWNKLIFSCRFLFVHFPDTS